MQVVAIVTIGYTEYAMEVDDAADLLLIAARARPVKHDSYDAPWTFSGKKDRFIGPVQLGEMEVDPDFEEVEEVQDLAVQPAATPAAFPPEPF